jgi:hypothetical protein
MADLESVFRTGDSRRDNFLSRVFGIFSEEVVRHWCANPRSTYVDLGRPTLYGTDGKWHTLDFTLQDQATSEIYVAEMKCELAYDNYRYLRLTDTHQLDHVHLCAHPVETTCPPFTSILSDERDPG